MTAICLLSAVCALLLAALLWLLPALRRAQAENRRLRELLALSSQSEEQEQLYRLRHDLRHYLLSMGQEGADSAPAQPGPARRPSIAALVEHYQEQAQSLGAQADIRLDLAGVEGPLLPDLYLVVSNLLENAVEALQREKGGWVRARCVCAEGYISLVVGNSCAAPPRKRDGRYLSSKAEGRFGLGLSIVEDIARQRGGQASFSAGDGTFRASVFLPRPAPAEPAPRSVAAS